MRVPWCIVIASWFCGLALTAEPVTVYLMDNGVRADHRVFKEIPIKAVDLLGDEENAFADHATLLAGLIVERAPAVKLVSVRTLNNDGEGKWSDFVKGVHWITNHHEAGRPAVANLSLGGVSADPRIRKLMTQAIDRLVESGVTVVVAAGNDGGDVPGRIPSTLDSVISVGAVTPFNQRLESSNFGGCVDVYAPGYELEGPGSISPVDRYRESGTSVAAAVVTGLVAAYLKDHPSSAPAATKTWILGKSLKGKVGNFPVPDKAELEASSLLIPEES